jgi:hypothetical protein
MIKKTRAETSQIRTLFISLIIHQPAVRFSQNKSATNNQPAVLFFQNKPAPAINHQPNEQVASLFWIPHAQAAQP